MPAHARMSRRRGSGVRIGGPDSPPSRPFRVPTEELEGILQEVSNPEGVLADGAAGSLDGAGLPPGDADRERDIRRKLQGLNTLDTLSDRAAQDARTAPIPNLPQEPASLPAPPQTNPTGSPEEPFERATSAPSTEAGIQAQGASMGFPGTPITPLPQPIRFVEITKSPFMAAVAAT